MKHFMLVKEEVCKVKESVPNFQKQTPVDVTALQVFSSLVFSSILLVSLVSHIRLD